MNLAESLAGVNWLAVVISTVIAFAVGAVWYSKTLFGSAWLEEVGLTEQAVNDANMPMTFGGTFVLQFLAVTALAVLLGSDSNWLDGLQAGLLVGVFWVATAYGTTYLFEQRSMRLFFINAGYNVVLFAIVGMIIGFWH
ncbi:MAG: DUF1761 domain-containing protein [Woeseiaceae bacterium]|nr:DUF1761 domain-containing protein [Woeseiaceae bacterium]